MCVHLTDAGHNEITERGRYAVALRERYGFVQDFGRLIQEAIASGTGLDEIDSWERPSAKETAE